MFTSPPYFNARPDYADYLAYEDYLAGLQKVIRQVHRVLEEGRFAAINCSPVLLRRAKRSEASRRIAVPFDIHQIFIQEGFDFLDDIIWEKPEGPGGPQAGADVLPQTGILILCGENVRTATEPLTRRRISILNAAIDENVSQLRPNSC